MKILKTISAPLKKVYGANESGNVQRPWNMEIDEESLSYKTLIKVYGCEDNIPRFVLHNGCPFVMVSTVFMFLLLISSPFWFVLKPIGKGVASIFEKINDWSDGVTQKRKSKRKIAEKTKRDSAAKARKDYYDNLVATVTKEDLLKVWYYNDYTNSYIKNDDGTVTIGEEEKYESLYTKIKGLTDAHQSEKASDWIKYFGRDFKDEYSNESHNVTWAMKGDRDSGTARLILTAFCEKNPDTCDEIFRNLAVPDPKNCEKRIAVEKAWQKELARRKKAEAIKKARDEFNRKVCLRIVKFVQGSMEYITAGVVIAVVAAVGFGLFKLYQNLSGVLGFVASCLKAINVLLVLEILVCAAAAVVLAMLVVLFIKFCQSGLFVDMFGGIWKGICATFRPLRPLFDNKLVKWVLNKVIMVVSCLAELLENLWMIATMSLKSECPTVTIVRKKDKSPKED